jgi:hypothetical protein
LNTSLFKSRHAFFAAILSAGFVAWPLLTDASFGARAGSSTTIVLWSGWTALAAMIAVTLYSLRKYAHRLGISPEFKMRATARALEKAESRLNALRADVLRGKVRERRDAFGIATRILREEGVAKVMKATIVDAAGGGAPFEVRTAPTEPLGRVATWLHVHAWYGLAAGVLVLVHGGWSFRSPLGATLNVLSAIVVLSGVVGIVLWAVGPRAMTARERDFTFEDAFVQNRSLKRKLAEAREKLDDAGRALLREVESAGAGFSAAAAKASAAAAALQPAAASALRDALVLAGQRRRVQSELSRLAPIKFRLNVWRLLHIPGTILLLVATLVHVAQAWRY